MEEENKIFEVFKGIKGETLSVSKGYICIDKKEETLLLRQSEITGFYVTKSKSDFKIRIYSSLYEATIREKKEVPVIIILSKADKDKFLGLIKKILG